MLPKSVTALAAMLLVSSSARAQPTEPPPPAPVEPAAEQPPSPAAPAPAPAQPAPAYPAQPGGYPPPAPAYPYPPPGQGMYVAPPPPPPPVDKGRHLHDGFYLRMALGGGAFRAKLESELESEPDRHISGGGAALDIMVGGTPVDGLVIGGAMLVSAASQPDVESDGQTRELDATMNAVVFGPFIDGFFDPRGGFHAGGALGLSVAGYQGPHTTPEEEEPFGGIGIAGWAGYDAWVSSDWSLGGYLRLMGTSGRREFDSKLQAETVKEQINTLSVAILFTALYH